MCVAWGIQEALGQVAQCGADDSECISGSQESSMRTSLLQTSVHRQSQGSFEFLSSHQSEDGSCDVQGSWNHDGISIHVAANNTAAELGVDGVARLSLLSDPSSSAQPWRLDGAVVDNLPWADQPDSVQTKVQSLLSAVVGHERALSSSLGSRGLDGKSMPCAHKLHMLLLTLAVYAPTNPYQNSTNWGGYQFGVSTGCPAKKAADWECRIVKIIGSSNTTWSRPPQDYSSTTRASANLEVECKADPGNDTKCRGLCGKGCDCWTGICGATYKCDYNPVCCAHDLACLKWGFFSVACANAVQVKYACSDDGAKLKPAL